MTPRRLGLHQGLAISTRESGMAPGPGSRTRIWPHVTRHSVQHHGTRVAGMPKGPGHMPPRWLRWQQMAKWYPGGWDCGCPYGTERLGWQQGLPTWHQGGWDGNRVWPQGTRVAGMATGSGHMAQCWLGWQQGLAKCHQGG